MWKCDDERASEGAFAIANAVVRLSCVSLMLRRRSSRHRCDVTRGRAIGRVAQELLVLDAGRRRVAQLETAHGCVVHECCGAVVVLCGARARARGYFVYVRMR